MRTYKLTKGYVQYMKQHGWKNQYSNIVTHGGIECNRLLGMVLGWMWKRFGLRVLK